MRQRSESSWAYGSWLGGKTGRCVWPPQRFGRWQSIVRQRCAAQLLRSCRPSSPAAVPRKWPSCAALACACATCRFFDPGLGNRALRRMQRRPRANFQVGAGLGQGRAGPAIKPSMAWVAVVGR